MIGASDDALGDIESGVVDRGFGVLERGAARPPSAFSVDVEFVLRVTPVANSARSRADLASPSLTLATARSRSATACWSCALIVAVIDLARAGLPLLIGLPSSIGSSTIWPRILVPTVMYLCARDDVARAAEQFTRLSAHCARATGRGLRLPAACPGVCVDFVAAAGHDRQRGYRDRDRNRRGCGVSVVRRARSAVIRAREIAAFFRASAVMAQTSVRSSARRRPPSDASPVRAGSHPPSRPIMPRRPAPDHDRRRDPEIESQGREGQKIAEGGREAVDRQGDDDADRRRPRIASISDSMQERSHHRARAETERAQRADFRQCARRPPRTWCSSRRTPRRFP